ncbi:MAG: hypothetical protein HC923_00215 [Myxococcales bacterium]|nr:hypothetical protein [Myxococcales bacterium]
MFGGSRQTSSNRLHPLAGDLFQSTAGALPQMLQENPWQAYGGQRVAGLTPQQQQAMRYGDAGAARASRTRALYGASGTRSCRGVAPRR